MLVTPYIEFQSAQLFLNSLMCPDFIFDNGNALEKIQFSSLVLELFVNSEFFNFLG